MSKAGNIFINLTVKSLEASKAFFTSLGFRFNPQFTDSNATCIVLGDNLFIMLLAESFFRNFTHKPVIHGHDGTEAIVALSIGSRKEVDELVDKALVAGGKEGLHHENLDFMYARSFEDPDGHIWELLWMDPAYIKPF
jgi:predicted lactoylglutathione lyase